MGPQGPPPGPPGPGWQPQPAGNGPRTALIVVAVIAVIAIGAVAVFALQDNDNGEALQDNDNGERGEFVDAIVESADTTTFPGEISESEIRCMAEVMVDSVGVDRLSEETSPEEIRNDPDFRLAEMDPTREQAEQIADGTVRCVDFIELVVQEVADDPMVPPGSEDCIRQEIDDDIFRRLMALGILDEDTSELEAEFESAFNDCMQGR